MATTVKQLVPPKVAETSVTSQYSPSLVKAIIDKATVTNTTSGNLALSVYLVDASEPPGDSNLIVKQRAIAPSECYTLPELVGQVIESAGYIATLASGTGLTIMFSGREIS